MDSFFPVLAQEFIGKIAAIIDDHVALFESSQMGRRRVPFVAVIGEDEIRGDLRFQSIKTAE